MEANIENTIYVNFFDSINEQKVKIFMAICSDLVNNQKPDTLYFMFSSPGGSITAGITLYNFLRGLPTKIIMHNIGSTDSIATIIFLAGQERYANPISHFLFHGVQWNFTQPTSVTTNQFAEYTSRIKHDELKMSNIYAERTNFTESEIQALFQQGEAKDPKFALEKGMIHGIKDISIPKGAPIVSINIP